MAITVHVKNFQSISDATVTIDRLTVITGPNNTGKSALMRAIMGVFSNTDGHAFVRNGTPHCEVNITFEDGKTVRWEKGKSVNRYTLNVGTPEEKVFNNIGRGVVPDEVMDLGIRFVPIGDGKGSDNKIWPQIARQWMGQVFLLDRSGSVLAEAISDTDRVGRLNRSLRGVEADQRNISSKLKVRRVDKKEAEIQLLKYEGLDQVVSEIEEISQVSKGLERMVSAMRWMDSKRTLREQSLSQITKYHGVDEIQIPDDLDDIKALRVQIRELGELQERRKKALAVILQYSGVAVDFAFTMDSVDQIRKVGKSLSLLRGWQRNRNDLNTQTHMLESEIVDLQKQINDLEPEILLLKEESKKCPTCGSLLHLEHEGDVL